jgi:ATP-binding cassette subfamily B protein
MALSPMILLFTAAKTVGPQIYKRSFAAQEELSALTSIANESITGIEVVHSYALEDFRAESFKQGSDRYRKAYLRFVLYRSVLLPIMVGMGGLGTLIILYFGGSAVISGAMSLGDFVAFLGYLAMLMWPTVALGWMLSLWERGRAAMDRIGEILETPPDVDPEAGDPDGAPLDNSIRFEGLSFGYAVEGGEDLQILNDITLHIEPGERVLLVGPSGAGKSSLVSLIPHLAAVPNDAVFVGGREIHDIPLKVLRSHVAFVPQEAFLFSMSLGENIGFGLDEPSSEDVERAAQLAALDADMARFPKGYATLVGERGVSLSGGQRQRMTIARAAMLKPGIWIFDDCLSSVDAGTEQRIIRGLHELTGDATAIFVTHRLLGFEGVDRAVVLQDGCITETGTHAELLELGGWYARLYRRQKLDLELSSEGKAS